MEEEEECVGRQSVGEWCRNYSVYMYTNQCMQHSQSWVEIKHTCTESADYCMLFESHVTAPEL